MMTRAGGTAVGRAPSSCPGTEGAAVSVALTPAAPRLRNRYPPAPAQNSKVKIKEIRKPLRRSGRGQPVLAIRKMKYNARKTKA